MNWKIGDRCKIDAVKEPRIIRWCPQCSVVEYFPELIFTITHKQKEKRWKVMPHGGIVRGIFVNEYEMYPIDVNNMQERFLYSL